jgi:hypothetical protein
VICQVNLVEQTLPHPFLLAKLAAMVAAVAVVEKPMT